VPYKPLLDRALDIVRWKDVKKCVIMQREGVLECPLKEGVDVSYGDFMESVKDVVSVPSTHVEIKIRMHYEITPRTRQSLIHLCNLGTLVDEASVTLNRRMPRHRLYNLQCTTGAVHCTASFDVVIVDYCI